MRLIFLGTAPFAVPAFRRLRAGPHLVAAVLTQPDRPQGRSRGIFPSAVKEAAQITGTPVFQPENLDAPEVVRQIQTLKPDFAIVVAYGRLLSCSFLNLFPQGVYNLHASLLPKFRGAAPIPWALIRGETETGVTIFRIDEQLDHGPVLLQRRMPILPEEDAVSLTGRLAELGAEAIEQAVEQITAGPVSLQSQEEPLATWAPRLSKESGRIDWKQTSRQIHNLVRGVQPWPGALTRIGKEDLKIHTASSDPARNDPSLAPGTLALASAAQGLWVQTGQGQLRIDRLQEAGGKVLPAADYLHGHPLRPGDRFQISSPSA